MQNGSLTADAWGHRQTEFNMENGPAGLKKKKNHPFGDEEQGRLSQGSL